MCASHFVLNRDSCQMTGGRNSSKSSTNRIIIKKEKDNHSGQNNPETRELRRPFNKTKHMERETSPRKRSEKTGNGESD